MGTIERAKYVLVPCLMGPKRGLALLPRADAVDLEDKEPSKASVIPSLPNSTRNSNVLEDFTGFRCSGLGVSKRGVVVVELDGMVRDVVVSVVVALWWFYFLATFDEIPAKIII